MRVHEARSRFHFAKEPIGAHRVGQLGMEHLERDLATVLHILGEIDGRHPATSELALDGILVTQRSGAQSVVQFAHDVARNQSDGRPILGPTQHETTCQYSGQMTGR